MDPLAHTPVGASLSQTRFGRVPVGTPTFVLAVNLPDIDTTTYFLGGNFSLAFRHSSNRGVLATTVLPLLLACMMRQVYRIRHDLPPTATPGRLRPGGKGTSRATVRAALT